MPVMRENTLVPEHLQVHSMTLFPGMVSASRADMFASEIGQATVLFGSDVRRLLTGAERKYGEYTEKVIIPANATIVKVIYKRPPDVFLASRVPPLKTVIYQEVETGAYGYVDIPVYASNHQQFGFDYKLTTAGQEVAPGRNYPKDTVLAHSNSIDHNGNYKFGINGKIAFMSINDVAQDGAIISKSFARRARFKGYGTRTLSFGGDLFGLNLSGNDDVYKIFPDIGERLPEDGLLFAVRKFDPDIAAVQLSRKGLKRWGLTDKRTYGHGGATVIGVEVTHNPMVKNSGLPNEFSTQCRKYLASERKYYEEILEVLQTIRRETGNRNPLLTPPLRELMRSAVGVIQSGSPGNTAINYVGAGGAPLNEYTVTITYSYDLEPNTRFKLADCQGGIS